MGFQLPTSTGKRRMSEPSTVSLQHIYQPIIQATFLYINWWTPQIFHQQTVGPVEISV